MQGTTERPSVINGDIDNPTWQWNEEHPDRDSSSIIMDLRFILSFRSSNPSFDTGTFIIINALFLQSLQQRP